MEKKVYFVSDAHLGIPDHHSSLLREKKLVAWLDEIKKDASEIFLLGDIFDFWFEYRTTVPKGYLRLFGKLAEIVDSGIPVHYFTGNHDMWMNSYFEKELGLKIHRAPIKIVLQNKTLFIGHGDGLGPSDRGYKLLKWFFSNSFFQYLFSWVHPDLGISLALFWSKKSRYANAKEDEILKSDEKERLFVFCRDYLKKEHIDYFVFGHRHLPLQMHPGPGSEYLNCGDWINYFSYIVFSNGKMEIKRFTKEIL